MARTRRLTALLLSTGLLALGGGVVVATQPAGAATTNLTVTTTTDVSTSAGACGSSAIVVAAVPLSLREATCLANNLFTSTGNAVVINLPAGTYDLVNGVLKLGTPQGSTVTLAGAGAASTIIDGGNLDRIISADSTFVGGVSVSLSGITFTHGLSNANGGGAIIGGSQNLTTPDTITIDSSVITDNHTNTNSTTNTFGLGGGVGFAGGSLTITNSVLSNNSANGSVGLAVGYRAQGHAPVETLTITNDVFIGNTGTNASGQIAGGTLSAFSYSASAHFNVSGSTFANNVITSTSGTAGGGAISANNGILSVTGSTFTGNAAAGPVTQAGGAILIVGTPTTLQYNRIFNNTAAAGNAVYAVGSTTAATENWWGCNTGPNTAGCGTTSGTVTAVPRLVLGVTASPTAVTGPHGVSTVTASLLKDSAGTAVSPALLGAFANLPIAWTAPLPSGASANPTSSTLVAGQASTSYDSGTGAGAGSLTGGLDNGTAAAAIAVNAPPVITSAASATFPVGAATTFTITTTGNPVPAITRTGTLPAGLTFTDNGNGTAKIAGTAAAGSGGTYLLNITAANGINPNATQTLTLTVPQAPTFTSATSATFTVGTSGNFTVTTVGPPTVTTITRAGALPAGLSFVDNGNGTATLAGTPSAGGSYPLQLTATNGINPNATQTLTVTVNQAPAVTTDPAGQTAQPGDTVTFTSSATGYPAPTTQWQVSTDNGGTFQNILGATSTQYSFVAALADSGNQYRAVFTNSVGTATSTAATLLVGTAPVITSANSTTFTVGTAGSFTVTATGKPAPALTGSGLPAWLTLTDNHDGTATLAGTPPAGSGGTVSLTLHASNGFAPADDQAFTLTIDESPAFTSANHATFVAGQQGQFAVTTTPGRPTATTLTETGTLPSGIAFTDKGDGTGTLSGTAAAGTAGKYAVTLTATAVGGSSTPTSQTFTLSVDEAATFSSADNTTFTAGVNGSFTIATSGGYPKPAAITETGTLPDGIDFTDNGEGTATLAGTPTEFGTFVLTLTADNGAGQSSSQTFTLTVDGPPTITSASGMTFTAGLSGTFTVTTRAGVPAHTAITEDGALPSGITFVDKGDGTAVLAGTADQTGTYQFMIIASNGVAPNARQQFVLSIVQAAAVPLPPTVPPSDGALSGVPTRTRPGQVLVHVSGSGFAAGAAITLGLYSPRTVVGHVNADSSGNFSAEITLPTRTGRYTILATGTGADGSPRYLEAGTTVTAAPASSSASVPTSAAPTSSSSGAGGLPDTGAQPLRPIAWAVFALIAGIALMFGARRQTRRH